MNQENPAVPAFTRLLNLASEKTGAIALVCTDDFFAEKENLIKQGRGIFIPDKYTDRGKWMDGWESRRKRTEGYDWCIVQLGVPGIIKGVDIDTNHFLGNHPPFASVDGCNMAGNPDADKLKSSNVKWTEVLQKSALKPGSQNFFELDSKEVYTHIRLNIFPDGGVARLKVYGEPSKEWKKVKPDDFVDLASALNGAVAILCNDMFFSHMGNLLMPGRGADMGDGWETKRNRTPGNRDWVIVRLAHPGIINKILVDTCHFKGNYPDACLIEGCRISINDEGNITSEKNRWSEILPKQKLKADCEHFFEKEITTNEIFSHIRLFIYPDGGISRIKLFGTIT